MTRNQFAWMALFAALQGLVGCGGGTPVKAASVPASLDVRVSAGGPVVGATVTVLAINDATGQPNTQAGKAGVLGSGGPTDRAGRVVVSVAPYSGPIQVVASGSGVTFDDPSQETPEGTVRTPASWPADLPLTSYLTNFHLAQAVVPVTMLTTLADHSALAYARGLHRLHARPTTISDAAASRDPLLVSHVAPITVWSASSLRATVPVSLTSSIQPLDAPALAALVDVGLNRLARDTSTQVGFSSSAPGVTAPSLLRLLCDDLDADAELDGLGTGGVQLQVEGRHPLKVDAQLLRLPLAAALDAWIRSSLNQSGIAESDLVAAKVIQSLALDGSDLFGDPPTGDVNSVIDHTPPIMAWVVQPPAAVAKTSVHLSVAASDSQSGVGRVLAQVGTGQPVTAAQQGDGTWAVDLLLAPGPNSITVWGEDKAGASPNSGQFQAAPFELSALVISDAAGPVIGLSLDGSHYRDERGLTVATDASGYAKTPPEYRYATSTLTAIPVSGGEIFKASSRLGWVSVPSAAQLEDANSGNAGNIPLLQFWNAYVPGVDAPISQATFSVALSCPTCRIPAATGSLWPSPRSDAGHQYWDLPLSSNLIQGLAAVPGVVSMTVTVTFTDTAGNATSAALLTLQFHVIGDPLAIVEDATYSLKNDPKSTYPYRISNGLYSTLFHPDLTTFLPEEQVRLVRYLVTNPSPSPVALGLPTLPAGWSAMESWIGDAGTSLGKVTYTPSAYICTTPPDCTGTTPVSYSGGSNGDGCGASPPHNVTPETDTPTVTAAALKTFAYNQALGWDSSPAQAIGVEQVIVPGATSQGPGAVALYFGRTVTPPARSYVLPWNGTVYQYLVEDAWIMTLRKSPICCDYDLESRRCFQEDFTTVWSGTRFTRTLGAGVDALNGSFQLATQGIQGKAVVGEVAVVPGIVTLTRSIPH